MKIVLPDKQRGGVLSLVVDVNQPPSVIRPSQVKALDHPLSLNWDRAINDEMHLRRCPVCGASDLYKRKRVPQLTGFLLIVLAAIIAMVLFGFGRLWWALATFGIVLILDVGIWLVGWPMLVCYRCQAQFHGKVVSSSQGRWDAATAERYARDQVDPIPRRGDEAKAPTPRPTPTSTPSGQTPSNTASVSDGGSEPEADSKQEPVS